MQRHLYEWPILAENHWPNHGRKLTIEQCIPCRTEQLEGPPVNARLSSQPVLNGLHHTYSWVATQSVEHSQAQCPVCHSDGPSPTATQPQASRRPG